MTFINNNNNNNNKSLLPLWWGRLIHGSGKIGDFQRILQCISETVQDRPMITMER